MGLRIGIAGAGIGGLAAAALLARAGHAVRVFDRFPAPAPVGSGLVIQPVGLEVLAEAGAVEAALARGRRITRLVGHEASSGRRVLDVGYGAVPGLAIHRASLFAALLEAALAAGAELVPGAHVMGAGEGWIELSGGGREGPFDLIVDAAGARSPLSPLKARPLPYGALWANVDWPEGTPLPPDRLTQRYRRADRMVGVLPIGTPPGETRPQAAIFWSLPEDGYSAWAEAGLGAWAAEATALWPDVAPFAAQVTEPSQMVFARYSHGQLLRPWRPGLAHIGDAAHRTSPQLGQGANMALLDALALTRALERAEGEAALRLYARARRAHVLGYQAISAAFTPQYQSGSRILPVIRDHLLAPLSFTPPLPWILTRLVAGRLVPPLGRLSRRREAPPP
ncbi:FAD-dependent oxidoreductase [Pseudoroseicyclus sp. CXY001]|uniref:FAD-dependent oxidoreductase n=1 Tax=Pseudoroseicyclus sp. CXY001 TaxID=3242492 RepID=UPI003570A3D3